MICQVSSPRSVSSLQRPRRRPWVVSTVILLSHIFQLSSVDAFTNSHRVGASPQLQLTSRSTQIPNFHSQHFRYLHRLSPSAVFKRRSPVSSLSTTATGSLPLQFLWSPINRIATAGTVKFLSQWRTYCLIPIIAGLVGWVTNYLAVKMIFYPIKWRGLPLWRKKFAFNDNQREPLLPGDPTWHGIGWQGIVPAKTRKMSEAMVNATLTQLLKMEEVVGRLDPNVVADILLPQTSHILEPMVDDLLDSYFANDNENFSNSTLRNWIGGAVKTDSPWRETLSRQFLLGVTKDFQRQVDRMLNVKNCVVKQMLADRSLLGKLFQIAGRKELTFLTDSGLWFGFLLGLIQLSLALVWDNPWTLSFGGLIVGLATNWLALKWIFEPVNPTPIVGNLVLQGLFLRRQKEVSADFSNFFATKILSSEQLWHSILNDPSTAPIFASIWAQNLEKVVSEGSRGIIDLNSDRFKSINLQSISQRATNRLYPCLSDLHPYVDETLDIENTLRTRMEAMTSQQFERVLHPIFEEDELTLILAGGGLGFLAGLIQQGLACGTIKFLPTWRWLANTFALSGIGFCAYVIYFASSPIRWSTFRRRAFKRLRDPSKIAFDAIDAENNGYLGPKEITRIARILGINLSEDQLQDAFTELDRNGDGRVSLEEFEDWWNQDLGSVFHKKLAQELGLYKRRRPKWTRLAVMKMRNYTENPLSFASWTGVGNAWQ